MLPPFTLHPPPSCYLHLPDVRIHYWLLGAGPPLVLLHGLGSSACDWFPVAPALAAHFRLLLIDLRGHGQSSLADSGYGIDLMATDVCRVMDSVGIERAHLLGLSLGGCVALQLACTAAQRLDHLILVNTFARLRNSGRLRQRLARLRHALGSGDALARLVATSLFADPDVQAFAYERLRRNDIRVLRRIMLVLARFDLRRQLPAVHAPTLVLIGDRDNTVPPRCADDLLAGLHRARLHVIPDAGHALPYDQPDAFIQAVTAFLISSPFAHPPALVLPSFPSAAL